MRELFFPSDPDYLTVRTRTQLLEYSLSACSFLLMLWLFHQFIGLLGSNPPERVSAYRSDPVVIGLRLMELVCHSIFFFMVVRKAFPSFGIINDSKSLYYGVVLAIIALPWMEQTYAVYNIREFIVQSEEVRNLGLFSVAAFYGLLPLWRIRLNRFQKYHTGGKIAATLIYMILIVTLVELLPY